MRTTVDLSDAMHIRVKEMAAERGVSMSDLLAELAAIGLEQATPAPEVDEETGLHLLRVGRPITTEEIATLRTANECGPARRELSHCAPLP